VYSRCQTPLRHQQVASPYCICGAALGSPDSGRRAISVHGIPEGRRAAIYELTQGFPLLLSLAIEEAATDGTSALLLKRFFDGTTRWMSPDEREWFIRRCYLDEVNEDTLRLVFPKKTSARSRTGSRARLRYTTPLRRPSGSVRSFARRCSATSRCDRRSAFVNSAAAPKAAERHHRREPREATHRKCGPCSTAVTPVSRHRHLVSVVLGSGVPERVDRST
jgi:hypothetical protein